MDCSCTLIKKDDNSMNITITTNSPPKKISLKKKILIEDLVIPGNPKTEKDKLSQNKSIMRALSGQDKYFDIKFLKLDIVKEKLPPCYSALSAHTQIKWNESLINYTIRYMNLNTNGELDKQLSEVITYLKSEKKKIKELSVIPGPIPIIKVVKDYNAMYSYYHNNSNYRNKIYAKIKLDGYPVSDVIISDTRLYNYTPSDTYIDITNKKWIINNKRHLEIPLTDDFIKDISMNKYEWLANNSNNTKISSTVINNGVNRWFATNT
jgi:hypothetical protein